MVFPRIPHVLVDAIGAASALLLSALAPLVGLVGAWAALTVVHALAVAVAAVLAMLVTAAGALVAADWRADFKSHQAWAHLGAGATELSLPVDTVTPWEIDPRYLLAVDSAALQRVFRAHRFVSSEPARQATKELPAAICATRIVAASEPIPAETRGDAAPKITYEQRTNAGAVSEIGISHGASRKLASTIHAGASIAVASRSQARTRLVANADAWSRWPGRDVYVLTRGPSGEHAGDVIVLGSSRDDRTQPVPEASTSSTIACGTEPPSCRGPPEVVGHRSRPTETAPPKLSVKGRQASTAGELSAGAVVRDNLGPEIPVSTAELDVIEIYLDTALTDLLASSAADPEDQA